MAFPPPTLPTNITDATDQAVLHPDLHNKTSAGVNDLTAEAQRVRTEITRIDASVNAVDDRVDATDANLAALDGRVDVLEPTVASLQNKAQRLGTIRGRTNIDAVSDGGSVRYTVDMGTWGVTDTGDGSGYTVPPGVYGVAASTIPDGGSDLTCYIVIGTRSSAVGSRLPGDGATYATWVGKVFAGEQIHVRVRMPTPRAVVGGRLEIWRLAESE